MGTTSSEAIGPFHPGTFLRVELLEPQQLSQHGLAMATGLPTSRINQIVLGRHGISAETDLRHCRYFGLSHGYFLHWQTTYDRQAAKRDLATSSPRK